MKEPALPRVPSSIAAVLAVLAGVLAACSNEGSPAPGPGFSPTPGVETIEFALGEFPDATVDVTLDVVDSSTLTSLYSQSLPAQATPFLRTFSFPPTPVTVTMTVTFHLTGASLVRTGTNTGGGGTTLTDLSWNFSGSILPMFAVNSVAAPAFIADVQAVAGFTDLTLSAPFPNGTYFLFPARQLNGTITRRYTGTESVPVFCSDNTLATVQFTASF